MNICDILYGMEKKIFKRTQDVFIQKNLFERLNEKIEKLCLNSKVLFLIEPYYYMKYQKEIMELKKYSLNSINVVVLKNYSTKFLNQVINYLDESYSLLLVLGESECFNFAKRLAKVNNMNTFFLCEKRLFHDVFSPYFYENVNGKIVWNECLPPTFAMLKQENDCDILNQIDFCSYYSNSIFYGLENFLNSIFFNENQVKFYYNSNNYNLNNVIINELQFQKEKVKNNLLDEIIFYSKIKNSVENKFLIVSTLLCLYRSFISKVSFNNHNFKNVVGAREFLRPFGTKAVDMYLSRVMPDKEKICFQLFTAKKILLKKIDCVINKVKVMGGYMRLSKEGNFEKIRSNFNLKPILNGIKLTAKLSENNTFLKIIDEFDLLI